MNTEPTAPLSIPPAALARWDAPHRVLMSDEDVADRIRSVAAPVVAAELRRLASEIDTPEHAYGLDDEEVAFDNGRDDAARVLRDRANELDPSA